MIRITLWWQLPTTGLLAILDRSELEGVMAHELSHIGNRDMLVSTVAVVLVGFVSIVSDMFMRSMLWGGVIEIMIIKRTEF